MDFAAANYRRYLEGDDEGIVEVIRDHKDGLTLYLAGIVGNIFTAEELTEETFFKLVVKKPRFAGKSSFKTWPKFFVFFFTFKMQIVAGKNTFSIFYNRL